MPAVHPGHRRGDSSPARADRGDVEVVVVEPPNRLVYGGERILEILAAAPRRSEGAQGGGAQTCRRRAGPGGIGYGQPSAVPILDEVEPVAPDLVARQEPTRELCAGDPGDPRREKVLLDLGGRGGGLAPSRRLDVVGVVVGELERRGTLPGDVREVAQRRSDAQQNRGDPAAKPEWLDEASRQLALEVLLKAREALGHDL